MMSGRRRSSGLCSLLCFVLLACVAASLAETNNPSSSDTSKSIRHPVVSAELKGDTLMARGQFSAALREYLRETNQSAVLLNKIGLAYHHLLAFDQARRYYQQALAINPKFPEALNNLGAIYYGDRNFAQAERIYRQALDYKPDHATILANLGAAYFADNKYGLGMEAYQKAVALDPNVLHTDARQSMVEGSSTREQAVARDYTLAKICAASGKISQAINYLRMALENGFHDRKRLMKERVFASLRSTPEFHQLMMEQLATK